ncbi:uncharacterized protein LOC121737416 [Aricia agestis]|uniref:uncharacterized protein LOC121737416 n=1 Tax=Aricia agestis TaxID=91739 RepID=UPI001C205076|nr:uncharacterized protein LOC121737416 [Aricia agestis]
MWLILLIFSSATGFEIKENLQVDIIESAINIANNNFNFRVQTTIVSKDVPREYIDKFISTYKGTVTIETNDESPKTQVVVLVKSFNSFMKILDKLTPDLKGNSLLHSGAKILIMIMYYPHRLANINKILWKYYVTDVIVVTRDSNRRIALYTYYPYKDHFNCHNFQPSFIEYTNTSVKNLYVDKTRNMRGCPLYISTDKLFHPITEQKVTLQVIKQSLTRLLSAAMNFTPITTSIDYVNIDSDSSKNWSAALSDILKGTANMSTCTVTLGIDGFSVLDFTIPYFRVRLGWLAPPPQPAPIWWPLYSPLSGYLWLILLLVIVPVNSLPLILKLKSVKRFCRRYFKNFDKLQNVAFRSWGIMMGQTIRFAPTRFRDFYIIGLWIWFTFVIRSAYQSVLIGALKSNVTIGKFLSVKEAVENGYRFGGKEDVIVHFEHDPTIKENYEIITQDKYVERFRDVLDGRTKFVFAMFLEYAWAYCLTQGWSEEECGHVIPDSIMTVPVVVWMKKNSAFKKSISLWVVRFLESGLLDKDTMKKPLMNSLRILDPTPLTINQLLSCILCLLIGYVTCFIVFLLEIVAYKTKAFEKVDKYILSKLRK